MATLETRTFDQLVEEQASAVQGSASALADFSVGSILRAFAQAVAGVVLWLQAIILQLLTITRAATSTGADLDSWVADYGISRLPAVAAVGEVTFARFTPTLLASVPVGTLVQTSDVTVQYAVIADTNQAAFDTATNAYILPAGTASITATVQATTAGVIGNAAAGAIQTLAQSISGVDTVTNASAFISGVDAESDSALRTRFVAYLASLSKATKAAIEYAITSMDQGLTDRITENYDYSGNYKPGSFYAVIDDGSGSPPSGVLDNVRAAIDPVRALGIQFAVFASTPVDANVALTIGVASGYSSLAVHAAVETAITNYIAALNMGDTLSWSRLIQIAYSASEGVSSVSNLLINGSATDLTATAKQVIVPGTITVS